MEYIKSKHGSDSMLQIESLVSIRILNLLEFMEKKSFLRSMKCSTLNLAVPNVKQLHFTWTHSQGYTLNILI